MLHDQEAALAEMRPRDRPWQGLSRSTSRITRPMMRVGELPPDIDQRSSWRHCQYVKAMS